MNLLRGAGSDYHVKVKKFFKVAGWGQTSKAELTIKEKKKKKEGGMELFSNPSLELTAGKPAAAQLTVRLKCSLLEHKI
jgi:hypothetical protein